MPTSPRIVLAAHAPLLALLAAACASHSTAVTPHSSKDAPAATHAIEIPREPARALASRRVVARGLRNPRGMQQVGNALLVAEAGTGLAESVNSGALLRLEDMDGDGDYLDEHERRTLLADQPSRNIVEIVRRDEVFGLAGMAEGDGAVLVALAFFGGPSTVFEVRDDAVTPWGRTHGNLNDVTFDPARRAWFAVASTTDEVVRLAPGSGATRVVKLMPLASGQDAVPGYLRHDPITNDLLVSLFSGSPEGEEGGEGIELVPRSASIVRVNPDTHSTQPFVTGLTVPTDLEIGPDGSLYVLEFCDSFLDPVSSRAAWEAGPSHGGFKRFSGRLLRIDRNRREVTVIAEGLDAPTNLAWGPGGLLIAEGMGTPGRLIPTADGPRPLEGFVELVAVP